MSSLLENNFNEAGETVGNNSETGRLFIPSFFQYLLAAIRDLEQWRIGNVKENNIFFSQFFRKQRKVIKLK